MSRKGPIDHQFGLFGFVRPIGRIPLKADDLKEVKQLLAENKAREAELKLRQIREGLENFSRTIGRKQKK